MKTLGASLIADYFISLSEPEIGDFISNLKLQKLLYYAQGFHLAVFGLPLFEEDIVLWAHGPVVKEVYDAHSGKGDIAVTMPSVLDTSALSEIQVGLLDNVYGYFGQFAAWKLRNMTSHEPPCVQTMKGEVISHKMLSDYFKTQVEESI